MNSWIWILLIVAAIWWWNSSKKRRKELRKKEEERQMEAQANCKREIIDIEPNQDDGE
jgi:hypothetical protein